MSARRAVAAALFAALVLVNLPAAAKDTTASILIHAGKADSANHALARQFAEAIAVAVNGAYTLDVEESQGSVQNVMDAAKATGNYIFTAPPNLIAQARRGDKPFTPSPRYREIRALFPIPAQTVHWVVRRDGSIKTLQDLAGHSFISGAKGSVGERLTLTALQVLGLDQQVQLLDIDAVAAAEALKTGQVVGFTATGSYPLPNLATFAATTPIRLLGLAPQQLAAILAADDSAAGELVPKGTYPGTDSDVTTLAMPAGVYASEHMPEATAYALTKAFWSRRDALAQRSPPWASVSPAVLASLKIRLHQGALRYYDEARIPVPRVLR